MQIPVLSIRGIKIGMCYCFSGFAFRNCRWSVSYGLWKRDLWYNDLWNSQPGDRLKFVFSPHVMLCGWLGSKHQLTNNHDFVNVYGPAHIVVILLSPVPINLFYWYQFWIGWGSLVLVSAFERKKKMMMIKEDGFVWWLCPLYEAAWALHIKVRSSVAVFCLSSCFFYPHPHPSWNDPVQLTEC